MLTQVRAPLGSSPQLDMEAQVTTLHGPPSAQGPLLIKKVLGVRKGQGLKGSCQAWHAGRREVLKEGHWVLAQKCKVKLQMWKSSPDRLGNLSSVAQQSNIQNNNLNLTFKLINSRALFLFLMDSLTSIRILPGGIQTLYEFP